MSDIATLGISIDSSAVVGATKALDQLTSAAKPAAAAATNLQKAAQANAAAHAGMSTQAMAAMHSVRSMAEQIALGIPPTQILAGQLNHLSFAATGPGGIKGAFTEALGALRGFVSGGVLATVGVAALAGGAYLAYSSWKTFALQLDDTAHRANETTSEMAKLQAAASFKGIDSADFAKGVGGFAQQIYLARQNAGELVQVLRVNGVSAVGDFNTLFGRAADLIKNAKDDQQRLVLLQQMGLPATMEWVRFMSQGAAGLKYAKDAAVEFGGAANDNMVRKAREFDDAWNKAWTNFGLYARAGVVNAASYFTSTPSGQILLKALVGALPGGSAILAGIGAYNAVSGGASTPAPSAASVVGGAFAAQPGGAAGAAKPGNTIDPNKVRNDIALAQPRLGPLGTLPRAPADEKPAPDQREAA